MNVEKYLDRTNKTASTLADELGLNASSVTAWKSAWESTSFSLLNFGRR